MPDTIDTPFDNKTTPLTVPGLHDLPINVLHSGEYFVTGVNDLKAHILTVKELAILDVINTITDRPGWHRAVFDQEALAQWRKDATALSPLVNDKTWDWCLQELQDKAREYETSGRLVVFNTASGVAKSDTALSVCLRSQFSDAVASLKAPVDPSLFPLVHGRTKVFVAGQACGLDEPSWSPRSDETPVIPEIPQITQTRDNFAWPYGPEIWSSKFQWLPCDVELTGPPGSTDVQITSYINNLHPSNREVYSGIETVISHSIQQWNDVLVRKK